MKLINIGSLHVPLEWIFITISFLLSVLILKIFIRKAGCDDKKILEDIWNGVFIFIGVWKLSLIIFEPKLVIQSPLSLLYFTGGDQGIWLGIVVAVIYIVTKTRKQNLSSSIVISILFFLGISIFAFFHLISIYLMEKVLLHLISGISTMMILITFMKTHFPVSFKQISDYLVIFTIFQLLLSYLYQDHSIKQSIFSTSQWIFIVIGVIGFLVQFIKKENS
jgi:hypothetical protein